MLRTKLMQGASLAAVALALVAAPTPSEARIGVTSTTTGAPLGKPPQQEQRVLKVGVDVFADERITTGADDRAHLLFADGSALTVGPNAELTIDRFVYDPNKGTGDLAISATRGVFRLVGGKITKQGEATMKVGSATLGLRGGIAVIDASSPGSLDAFFMFGDKLVVTTPQGTKVATRPGSTIKTIFGQSPSSPSLTPAGALVGPLAKLEAPSGSNVQGTSGVDAKVNQSGLNSVNSDQSGGGSGEGASTPQFVPPALDVTLRPVSADGRYVAETAFLSYNPTTGDAARDPNNNTGLADAGTYGGRLVANTANGINFNLPWTPGTLGGPNTGFVVDQTNATSDLGPVTGMGYVSPNEDFYIYYLTDVTTGNKVNLFAGDRTLATGFQTTGVSAREMLDLDTALPFLPESVSLLPVAATAPQGQMFIAHSPILTNTQMAGSDQRATWFQASLNFEGSGSAQSSFLSINIGQFGADEGNANALFASGGGQASLRETGTGNVTRFTSNISTAQTATGDAIYGAAGEYFVFLPDKRANDLSPPGVTPQAGAAQDYATLDKTPYYYVTSSAPTTAPAGLGASRTDRTMTGFAAGQLDQRDGSGNITTTLFRNTDASDVTVTTSATNNRASASMTFTELNNPYAEYKLLFGSTTGVNANSSAFVDDQRFAIGTSPTGGSTYNGDPVVTNLAMVTHQAVADDADLIQPGAQYCACEFMSWGYWQGEVQHTTGPRAGEYDRVHIGTWVAGTQTDLVDIPMSGTATYTGHAIGNVSNNGASYVAVGEFRQVWNFGTRAGAVNIDNFDGGNYSGFTGAPGNGRDFSGTINGIGGTGIGRSGNVDGTFYASPTSPIAGQGGSFAINGANYSASGTFAGQKQ